MKQLIKNLLERKEIDLFIGYEQGTRLPRPLFVTSTEDTNKLIFNEMCTGNLAVYLTHADLVGGKKVGIAASYYALRSISRLFDEHQLQEDSLKVYACTAEGEPKLLANAAEIKQYIAENPVPAKQVEDDWVKEIDAMPANERWAYWTQELSKCFKCYACRAACPMCYCTKCIAEVNRPQWIQPWASTLSNMDWQINRVMHQAGRCSDCGACGAACPLGLPIHILSHKLYELVHLHFGEDVAEGSVLSTFQPNDKENFIK
jgi:ferredoxin